MSRGCATDSWEQPREAACQVSGSAWHIILVSGVQDNRICMEHLAKLDRQKYV